MQIIAGCILLIIGAGIFFGAAMPLGAESVAWLARPWMVGQAYVIVAFFIFVVGVSLIVNAWPS